MVVSIVTGHCLGMDLLVAEGAASGKLLAQWLIQVQAHVRLMSNMHGHFRSGHNRDHQGLMQVKSCADTFVNMGTQCRHVGKLGHAMTTDTSTIV